MPGFYTRAMAQAQFVLTRAVHATRKTWDLVNVPSGKPSPTDRLPQTIRQKAKVAKALE